jgi:hypothetical protein
MDRVFDCIPAIVLEHLPHDKTIKALVIAAWSRTAGESIKQHSAVLDFVDQTLIIGVADDLWRSNLERLAPQMVARINSNLKHGTLRRIEFRLDEAVGRAIERCEAIQNAVPDAGVCRAAEAIEDDSLREAFLAAAATYLEAGRRRTNFGG